MQNYIKTDKIGLSKKRKEVTYMGKFNLPEDQQTLENMEVDLSLIEDALNPDTSDQDNVFQLIPDKCY